MMGTNRLLRHTSLVAVLLLVLSRCCNVADGFVVESQQTNGRNMRSLQLSASSADDGDQEDLPKIPQLPAIGSSSTNNPKTSSDSNVNENKPFVASKKFQLQYTCNICETRNCHLVSRIAYRNGVVIARCKGCDSQHLIADNLGWTDYDGGFQGETNTIEDYFAESNDKVSRVSEEVFQLEKILQEHDTTSGSIVGEDGELALE